MNSAGYNERLNSAESVVFIVRCLRAMDRRLRKAAKASGPDVEERLTVFQKYTYNICFELRKLMYRSTSALFIDTRGLKKVPHQYHNIINNTNLTIHVLHE
jgi:hypothetical protein